MEKNAILTPKRWDLAPWFGYSQSQIHPNPSQPSFQLKSKKYKLTMIWKLCKIGQYRISPTNMEISHIAKNPNIAISPKYRQIFGKYRISPETPISPYRYLFLPISPYRHNIAIKMENIAILKALDGGLLGCIPSFSSRFYLFLRVFLRLFNDFLTNNTNKRTKSTTDFAYSRYANLT